MKFKLVPIAGDASFRKFYRIISNKKSKILVTAEKEKYKNLIVYSAINTFLRKNKILTPKLFSFNYSESSMVIEDFGDLSFYKLLLKKKNKFEIYKKLVDLILIMQKIKPKKKIKTIFNKYYLFEKYSYNHLHRESDLFFKWYLPLILEKKKIASIKKKIKKNLSNLYKNLNYQDTCFVHRDYHVQNLIKIRNKIGVIDSQDALIGNPAYDLASLIDDVRIKNSAKLKNKIYNYYINKIYLPHSENALLFLKDFNILSVQRILKIIGIFSRLYTRDKKIKYLKFIPYAWKLLEMRIKSENFSDLKNILDKNISKKIRKQVFYK